MFNSPSGIDKRTPFSRPLDIRAFLSPILLALALLMALPEMAQSQSISNPALDTGRPTRRTSSADIDISSQAAMQQHRLLAQLNADRQKSMVSDANKLLRLAQELNAELARADSGLSPAQQAHIAAEIEKLARNVREKMSFAVGVTSTTDSPFTASVP